MKVFLPRICILSILFFAVLSSPVTALSNTTEVTVLRYANDGITLINETTVTYQWMMANLPVLGDGITHYYSQGPTFNSSDLWDDAEWQNIDSRDWGAVEGTDLKDLCNLLGLVKKGESVAVVASDGLEKTFSYESVYKPNSRQGPLGITWYKDGMYPDSGYDEGMRLIMFADAKANTYGWNTSGWHVFGNADMRDTWLPAFWYNYSGIWPSSGGTSVKYIRYIKIFSTDPVPLPLAHFTSNITSGTAPLTVKFTDASEGDPTSWNWSLQNVTPGNNAVNGFSTARNPVYIFGVGNWSIKLNVTNSFGSNVTPGTYFINVSAGGVAPVANFISNVTSGTAPLSVAFTDTSINSPTSWNWSLQNVTPGNNTVIWFITARNPVYIFGVGKWSIKLNATNSFGSNVTPGTYFINVSSSADHFGVFRSGSWFVDWNGNGAWDATDAQHIGYFGANPGDIPLVGDWDGSGVSRFGVFRNGSWFVDWNGNGAWDATDAQHIGYFGANPGDIPLVGDWDGSGVSRFGVFRNGSWFVDWNGNGAWDATDAQHTGYFGANPGDIPLAGSWV
jgi:PKD repeat protein